MSMAYVAGPKVGRAKKKPVAKSKSHKVWPSHSAKDQVEFVQEFGSRKNVVIKSGFARPKTRSEDWGRSSPAYVYARAQLRGIERDLVLHGQPVAAPVPQQQMLRILNRVLAEDSLYPSMSIDEDNTVLAEWRVGLDAITAEVDAAGQFTWFVHRDGRPLVEQGSITVLRRVIRDVSAVVDDLNPSWRALFPTAHSHR